MRRRFGPKARLSAEDEDRQKRSWAEIKAGRLPLSAQERLAGQIDEQVFTSALSTRDLVAVRAAGYEPVGQAFGTATFALSRAQAYLSSQPVWTSRYGPPTEPYRLRGFHAGELTARGRALARLTEEGRALGGDGVIGVSELATFGDDQVYEFSVVGTAVRRRSQADSSSVPFLTRLDGADWGQLERGGWSPVGRLLTTKVRWACPGPMYWAKGGGRFKTGLWETQEIGSLSRLHQSARADARSELEAQIRRVHAEGMILHSFEVTFEQEEGYYWVEVDAFASAIQRLPGRRPAQPSTLAVVPIIRLDEGSNQ
ncbi:MAG: hypothetical protein JWM76_383 [Pseudonocardiales bacterium]|nr:hypothetical protein [Pseudonocardiales bacterium]